MRPARLLHGLLRRELTAGFVAAALLSAAAGALAGSHAGDLLENETMPAAFARLFLRFDLTLLGVFCILTMLRCGQRTAEDSAARWLEPYAAAGGDRRVYALALPAAVAVAAFAAYMCGALGFAIAVWRTHGSAELLLAAPAHLPRALLLITCFACYNMLFAVPIREPLASFALAALLAAAPLLMLLRVLLSSDSGAPPALLRLWLNSYPPPLVLAGTLKEWCIQLLYVAVAGGCAALLAQRYSGRRA